MAKAATGNQVVQTQPREAKGKNHARRLRRGGRVPATVYGAALAPGFAGLYQVAIQVPAAAPSGDQPIVATVDNVSSPSATLITIQ